MATERIELGMTRELLPHLRRWAGVREFAQNALDGEVEHGAKMEITWRDVDGGRLFISNFGCTMPREALMLGHSSKRDRRDLIGKFGTGLKLGALAIVRESGPFAIRNGRETWTFDFVQSATFRAETLAVTITQKSGGSESVQVEIPCPRAEWDKYRRRFLRLRTPVEREQEIQTAEGSLLLDPADAGDLFVRGIWVGKLHGQQYGYDLDVELNHERQVAVNSGEVEAKRRRVWELAFAQQPARLGQRLFEALGSTTHRDVDDFSWGASDAVEEECVRRFVAQHGAGAVPCETIEETREMAHFALGSGKTGVVVPSRPLRSILRRRLGSPSDLKAKLKDAVVKQYSWGDLDEVEQNCLGRAIQVLFQAGCFPEHVQWGEDQDSYRVDVVDFADPQQAGLAQTTGEVAERRVSVARGQLAEVSGLIRILIHELAHAQTGASDGDRRHVQAIESAWTAVAAKFVK